MLTDAVAFCGMACVFMLIVPVRVGEFGIDSNIFAPNYKAPTNHDHIGVAMIHVDDDTTSKKKEKSKAKGTGGAIFDLIEEAEEAVSQGKEAPSPKEAKAQKKSATKPQLKSWEKAQLTLLDTTNVFDSDYKKPLQGHWVNNPDRVGQKMWVDAKSFAEGSYPKPSRKPRTVSPGPST